jgi:hypothetical protein
VTPLEEGSGEARRWLWITLAVPDPPTNGQFLYSKGLIEAARFARIHLDVIAVRRADGPAPDARAAMDDVRWWIARDPQRSRWISAVSPLPHIASRANTRTMRLLLRDRLHRDGTEWEAIVFDSLAAGWALRPILGALRSHHYRPRLIYVAHNHETSLARRLAAIHPHALKRQISRIDAVKVALLERALARRVDVITADSPDDCVLFRAACPHTRVEWLPPVFLGSPVRARWIGPQVPRRAVMLGTFDWLPKRFNLIEFLRAADPLFAAAGIELQVVGAADRSFLDQLRPTVRATTFTGPVKDPGPYLASARIGVVAERVGGGFKLKTLDYVFSRVPMAALTGTIPGMPVIDGESAIIAPDAPTLARRIVAVIDDFDMLNRLQSAAHRACVGLFDVPAASRVLSAAEAWPVVADTEPLAAGAWD